MYNSKFGIIVAAVLALIGSASPASAYLTAKANHDHITIDFFYHGSTVSVKGEADAGADLVIKITSPDGHQTMKKKGKVGGLLWMNVGTLSFEHTPDLYAVYSTRELSDILSREEMEKQVIGYPSLAGHVAVTPAENPADKERWFNEFVKYKEASSLYTVSPATIKTTALENGRQEYYIMTSWPYQAAPGDYTVTVYAVKGSKVVEQAESHVKVEQVGMVKSLAAMAKNSAAVYGFLSISIALGAGFGVGLIFRKGGGAH